MQNNELRGVLIFFLLVGIGIFLFLEGIPTLYAFNLSFRYFSIVSGAFGSPWVGLDNFQRLFSSYAFSSLLANSIVLFIVPTIVAIIIAFPGALMVGGMTPGRQRSMAMVALLLPAFIPDVIIAFATVYTLPSTTLANPNSFRVVLILLSVIRPASVCAFVGACAAGLYNDRNKSVSHGAAAGIVVGIAVSVVRFLTSNLELHTLLVNPLVLSATDTFDHFIYRQGLIMAQFSFASAAWFFRTIPQVLAAILVSFIVYLCVRSGLNEETPIVDELVSDQKNPIAIAPAILCALALLVFLFLPLAHSSPFMDAPHLTINSVMTNMLPQAIVNSALTTVFSALLFSIPLFMLTVWLCTNIHNRGAVIFILLLVSMSNNTIGEFLFYHTLGLVNTHLAVIFSNAFNFAFVLPLAYLARLKVSNTKAALMKERPIPEANCHTSLGDITSAARPYLVAFCGLFIANIWGGSHNQIIYTMDQRLWGTAILLRQAAFSGGELPSAGMVLGVSLPVLVVAVAVAVIFVGLGERNNEERGFDS